MQGTLAYALWGLVAAFWKLLAAVSPIELVAHRAIWGLVAFASIAFAFGQRPALRAALRDVRLVGVMLVSATLLATNWCIFVWATINGHLLDASLGYFINPLVSVALGTTRPRRTAAPSPVGCDRDRDDGSRAARVSRRPRAVDRA